VATSTQPRKVLVLSDEPMTAALLGMLLELEGYEPAFAQLGENPEAALGRLRPLLVVVVQDSLAVAKSDLFVARAARRQIGVVMFSSRRVPGPPPWVLSRRLPWFRMPVDTAGLRRAIEASTASFRLWRGQTERRQSQTETDADGILVYRDAEGRRWRVYDRRGSDRRRQDEPPAATPEGSGHRTFVNEAGEEWRVTITADEFLDESPAALESQLSRAKRTD
jgi:hypothetical protein